jgi:hypothetical protein
MWINCNQALPDTNILVKCSTSIHPDEDETVFFGAFSGYFTVESAIDGSKEEVPVFKIPSDNSEDLVTTNVLFWDESILDWQGMIEANKTSVQKILDKNQSLTLNEEFLEKLFEELATDTDSQIEKPSLHVSGAKDDCGKLRMSLVLGKFPLALKQVAEVGTRGAKKYTDNGWIEVPNGIERYTDAMLRHYFEEAAGIKHDPEWGLLHASHLAWNALARLELMLLEQKNETV